MAELAALLGDAPPGELDAVRQDILAITQQSHAVSEALKAQAARSNLEQFRLVSVRGQLNVLSKFNQLDETTFYTHGARPVKFEVDHLTRETTVLGDYDKDVSGAQDTQRALDEYLERHYAAESVAAVFDADGAQHVVLVGRKLSPQNFFNGQLTAAYTVEDGSVKGEIRADVHYFEDGNVRLKSHNAVSAPVRASVAETIEREETEFENELNRALLALNDQEFKEIRRQLPITRQPVDWQQAITGCNVGQDLENR